MYEANEIDIVRLSADTYHARQTHADEYITEPIHQVLCLAFVPNHPPFDDPQVRRAFVMAVDRERLAAETLDGIRDPATGGFIPPSMPGHSPGIGLPFDPDQARQLLEEAGYPNGQGFPDTKIMMWEINPELEYLQEQWLSNLNVDIAIDIQKREDVYDWFYRGNLRLVSMVGVIDPDIEGSVRLMLPEWQDDRFEKIVEEAQQSLNQQERIGHYQEADSFLIEEALIMPIHYSRSHFLVKPWVKILTGEVDSWYLKDFIIEPH
jgi:oligopeptide transport system substrate-binding protein